MENSLLINQMQCLLRSANGGWHARAVGCGNYAWAETCEDAMRAAIALKGKPGRPTSTSAMIASSERKQRTLLL